ncbi:MAG: polymer-forming cytoskeletal protein [Anaerolineae bacterium]|nr:polymer-forming cytoskeletal protein [Anaerolineae bacterium]
MANFFGNRRKTEQPISPQTVEPTPPPVTRPPMPSITPSAPIGFETVLGASSVLEGKLKSDGNIRLDGIFTGTLEISGNVLVGENAKIDADIDAKNISIAGAVRGNVTGNKVQLLRSARVWGDITATTITTEEGAFIEGKINMLGSKPVSPFETETPVTDTPLIPEESETSPTDEANS